MTDVQSDLLVIAEQEKQLAFTTFDEAAAWSLGQKLRQLASTRGHAVVIDIRRFQLPLFYAALPGTTPDNLEWVRRKNNVVAHFFRSSYSVGLYLQTQNSSLQEKQGLPLHDYATHGGAFPLSVVGVGVIGSVTVSGLPQRQDHELVVEALCAELGKDYQPLKLA